MTKNIFLIDNDLDDRELFCEALREVAPEVGCYTATNGRTSLEKLQTREIPFPDLIFLDVNMPIMNGWKCLTALKEDEKLKNIPVIMCSTSDNMEDVHRAHQMGALCFFSKSADFNALKQSLELVVQLLASDDLGSLAKGKKSACFL